MRFFIQYFFLLFVYIIPVLGASPIPYSGKVAMDGINYHGHAQFTFSLGESDGTVHWRNGADANASVPVFVRNGRYSVLLGGQGMTPLPPKLFLDQVELYLTVHLDTNESTGLRHLAPDQLISATPRALAAEWAKMARLSEGVSPGAITRAMLSAEVLADLNNSTSGSESNVTFSPTPGSIVRSMLASDVQSDLNRTVTKSMLGSDVLADLNKTITKSMLGSDVLADLNNTLAPGSVSREKLSADILVDLNKTITKSMLGSDVLADLNQSIKSITRDMLPPSVLTDLNRTVTSSNIAANTITTAQLNEQILKYLKPEITLQPQIPGLIFGGQSMNLTSQAQGKYLTYQWQRNGQPIAGATGPSFSIAEVNGTLHDGNYTLVVSNDFGSVTSTPTALQVDGTPSAHTVASISMEMIFCPPGTFTMGSPTTEAGRQSDRENEHNVSLTKGFYLGKYEVTQAQYEAVMTGNTDSLSATPSQWPNNPNRPVEKVSWADAQIFLTRLNVQQSANIPAGWAYVLPTESQWEYACRAGTTTMYSWGNDINATRANYSVSGLSQTRDVGYYSANSWGFFDMHGNVWEWTADWYQQAAYPTGNPVVDPTGPGSGSTRVRRGGSWYDDGTDLRSARRSNVTPSNRFNGIGFRVGFQQQ